MTFPGGKVARDENPPLTSITKMSGNHVDVVIDDQPVRALIDSGASYSVISESYRRQLKKIMFPDTRNTVLKVADGKYVQPVGKCAIRIEINGRIQPFEVVVLSNCSHDVILGWDFLESSQAVIDCGRSELLLGDGIFSEYEESEMAKPWRLCSVQDCIIAGRAVTRVPVVCPNIAGSVEVIVECNKLLTLGKEIFIASSIITLKDGLGEIWVTNSRKETRDIPKGMYIGKAEQFSRSCLNAIDETSLEAGSIKANTDIVDIEKHLNVASELTSKQRHELLCVLRQFHEAFNFGKRKKPTKIGVKHRIYTEHNQPISQRAYRVSPSQRRTIQTEVKKMLEDNIIQPSVSPWSSPVVLVKKKDGNWRFCVDYRKLNKFTKKDVYPLPRIDDTLDSLSGSKFFSSMDLYTGYWQIEVDEADREKTAFITPEGLYEFKVMPFGLCNAPATFERMMDNLLRHLKWTMCLCYLDDIVVFSKTFEDHLDRLHAVLKCIDQAGLKLNPKKCVFGAQQIKILGHVVSENEVRPDPDKVRAVMLFPKPKNIRDVKSFLGLCSYYRRFIKDFCTKAHPLQILLKGDSQFSWGTEQDESFEKLKIALTSNPVLGLYEENTPIKLHTDASGYGVGAVLIQVQHGQEKVIAYASKVLSKAEKNYSTTERECLAVVWAINKFRPYLYSKPFTVVTDHHSLCWLMSLKDPSGRLARWSLRIQEYDVTIKFKSGRKHQDADCLSRYPMSDNDEPTPGDINALTNFMNLAKEQRKDPKLLKIIQALENKQVIKGFDIVDEVLYKKNYDPDEKKWLPVIPKHLRIDILKHFHDAPVSGHLGSVRTYDRIRKRFCWPGLYRSVRHYVVHCRECQRRKSVPQKPPGRLISIPPAMAPFHRIGIDLLGQFPKSTKGNKWIVVCTDYLTRYAVTKALPTAVALEIAKFLVEDILLKHGAPRVIISDRGKVFQSKLVSELIRRTDVNHRMTTSYHPQTNGLTERFNKTLANMLSMYVDVEQKDWDVFLPFVTFAYNTSKQDTTGFTPFFLLHGREAETTMDTLFPFHPEDVDGGSETYVQNLVLKAEEARQLARLRTLEAQEKDRLRYDASHRPVLYSPGDLVWVFTPVRKVGLSEKLLKRYFGPYKVLRQLSDVTFEVEDFDPKSRRRKRRDVVHVLRMKPYYDPDAQDEYRQDTINKYAADGKGPNEPSRTVNEGRVTRSRAKATNK